MKSSYFWDIMLYSLLKVNQRYKRTFACCFLHADFLLDLLFSPEAGGDMFLETLVDYQKTAQSYIPENRTLKFIRLECVSICSFSPFSAR
jgi:hypothetical protein